MSTLTIHDAKSIGVDPRIVLYLPANGECEQRL